MLHPIKLHKQDATANYERENSVIFKHLLVLVWVQIQKISWSKLDGGEDALILWYSPCQPPS